MTSIPAYQSGLAGIQKGMTSLNDNAQKIASAVSEPNPDLITPAVGLLQAKQQVEASAKVIETENSLIGTLLDITV